MLASLLSAAQTIGGLWEEPLTLVRETSASSHGWGSAVAVIEDQDGDGLDEIVVGDPLFSETNALRRGRIQMFSGADGSLLFEYAGRKESLFGWALSRAPDLDHDGFDDLLVGAPGFDGKQGRAAVLSPRSGQELLALSDPLLGTSSGSGFGAAVCVTSSQTEDFFVIGAPHADYCGADGGSHSAYDRNGAFLTGTYGCSAGAELGSALAPLPGSAPNTAGFVTRQLRFGSLSAQVLIYHSLYNYRYILMGTDLGSHLATGADWNGDGYPDIAIGSAQLNRVAVYDGWTSALLETYEDPSAPGFPSAVALAEDMDGDGAPELAVGVTGDPALGQRGEIRLFAPGAGHFRTIVLAAPHSGGALAGGPRLNASGLPSLVAGANAPGPPLSSADGSVSVLSFLPILTADASTVSAAGGGSVHFNFHFGKDYARGRYRLLVSATGTGPSLYAGILIPLTFDTHLDATRRGIYPGWVQRPEGVLDLAGRADCRMEVQPNGIPQQMLGRSFQFAVACAAANTSLRAVSVARTVEIIL